MRFLDLTIILGGLALFLNGMALARGGLQGLAGDKLRGLMASVTRNRLLGLLSGIGSTVIIQSSTATTVMLVGFAASGVITLGQALALLLGADIGTSLTVQLLSFRLSSYALLITFIGFAIRFAAKRRRARYLGESVMGFGLLFYGLQLMAQGAAPLTGEESFARAVTLCAEHPHLGILGAALFTVLLQGSAPTIGILLSLAHGGLALSNGHPLTLAAALPIVLGANLGTTVSPLLASLKQEPEGRRVALAHILIKVAGVLVALPLLGVFEQLLVDLEGDLARQIANAHLLFNVGVALLFLPFTQSLARLMVRLYNPAPSAAFGPRYLDPRAIDSPPLAFGLATREFLRMSDIVRDMLLGTLPALERNDLDQIEDVEARFEQVDILNREIRFYLAGLGQERLPAEQARKQLRLITLTSNVHGAGDTVTRNLMAISRKKALSGLQFSEEGMRDLALFHAKVVENFDLSVTAYSSNDEELARRVLRHNEELAQLETNLKQRHIDRIHKGLQETLDTSAFHFDVISQLRRISLLLSELAQEVVTLRTERRRAVGSDAPVEMP